MGDFWKRVQEVAAAVRPAWLAAVIAIGTGLALHHEQAVDVLISIAEDDGLFSGEHSLLLLSLLTLGFCGWYFPRSLLYVEYWFTPEPRERFEKWRLWVPRVIGVTPMLSLGVAYVRGGKPGLGLLYLIVAALFWTFLIYRRRLFTHGDVRCLGWHRTMPNATFVAMMSLVVFSLALLAVFLAVPVTAPQSVGPIGIIFFAMASWIAFGCAVLIYPTHRYRLPSLVLVAIVFIAVFSFWNDNHQVRTLGGDVAEWQRSSVDEHFAQWLDHRRRPREEYARAGRPYPVFVVAAEGGGIRAAYWTASVLVSLEDSHPGLACHVFAISGVSGGSLGGALFAALIADQVERSGYACDGRVTADPDLLSPTVKEMLAGDFLAPALAGMLFPDFIQRFLPLRGRFALPDRAAYLESAWEKAWRESTGSARLEESFRDLWEPAGARYAVPSLFLNGTWVGDGGRNVTSNLRPASSSFVELDDVVDLFGRRMRLSTAVHMSARFTYLSPAGTVRVGEEDRRVVDGGYFENSGALTASEIVSVIQDVDPRIEIHALIISNHPQHPANPERVEAEESWTDRILPETLSPLCALFNTRMARGYHADRFLAEAVEDRLLRFQLSGVGPVEVPLGWMLSSEMRGRIDAVARDHPSVAAVGDLLVDGRN
jgi:predicted acylesterase/phospholipase RssA